MNAKLFLKNSLREEEKSTIEQRSHLLRFAGPTQSLLCIRKGKKDNLGLDSCYDSRDG